MKSVLVLATKNSGHGVFEKKKKQIVDQLSLSFNRVEVAYSSSAEEGAALARNACGKYHSLIIVGGDGTFHSIVNALMQEKERPILGYINNGTLGDVGRAFGIGSNWKKALRKIIGGETKPFDLVRINEEYFVYMAAVGAYSDVSYKASRKSKKFWHHFSYYFLSIKEAFHPYKIHYRFRTEKEEKRGDAPFIMLLNGSHVGGFNVNKNGRMDDGEIELFITPNGAFNGLLHYLFRSKKAAPISVAEGQLLLSEGTVWCLDGEKTFSGSVAFHCEPRCLSIYC